MCSCQRTTLLHLTFIKELFRMSEFGILSSARLPVILNHSYRDFYSYVGGYSCMIELLNVHTDYVVAPRAAVASVLTPNSCHRC